VSGEFVWQKWHGHHPPRHPDRSGGTCPGQAPGFRSRPGTQHGRSRETHRQGESVWQKAGVSQRLRLTLPRHPPATKRPSVGAQHTCTHPAYPDTVPLRITDTPHLSVLRRERPDLAPTLAAHRILVPGRIQASGSRSGDEPRRHAREGVCLAEMGLSRACSRNGGLSRGKWRLIHATPGCLPVWQIKMV
jgi:hypothetical protein